MSAASQEARIVYTRGAITVRDADNQYTVYVDGLTHATADSSYGRTPDGLSLAIARVDYMARTPIYANLWGRYIDGKDERHAKWYTLAQAARRAEQLSRVTGVEHWPWQPPKEERYVVARGTYQISGGAK